METEIHSSSRWHIDIYAHSATATLLSITFPRDKQTLFGPCGSILRYKLRQDLGLKRESTAAVALSGGFLPQKPWPYAWFFLQVHTCNRGPALSACLLTILWNVGYSRPCLCFEQHDPHCSWTQSMVGRSKQPCIPWRGLSMRGMQWLDNAVCISTEHVVLGLGSDFLQDKCSWHGSMGRAFLSALVSRGSPRTIWALPNLLPRLRHWQDGHLQP